SETGGSVFRFAEHVRRFVFAADVGEALELAAACCREKDRAARFDLRFCFRHASNHVAVKAWTGTRRQLELRSLANREGQLLEIDLRGLGKRGRELRFGPEIVFRRWSVGFRVALVVFGSGGEVFFGGRSQHSGLVEKNNRPQRAFRKLEQRALSDFASRSEKRGIFPGSRIAIVSWRCFAGLH